jgi:hypothetical protein
LDFSSLESAGNIPSARSYKTSIQTEGETPSKLTTSYSPSNQVRQIMKPEDVKSDVDSLRQKVYPEVCRGIEYCVMIKN